MTKLPTCPFCEDDELWIFKAVYYVEIKCYNCGLIHTIAPRPSDADLDDAVAAIVAAARARAPASTDGAGSVADHA